MPHACLSEEAGAEQENTPNEPHPGHITPCLIGPKEQKPQLNEKVSRIPAQPQTIWRNPTWLAIETFPDFRVFLLNNGGSNAAADSGFMDSGSFSYNIRGRRGQRGGGALEMGFRSVGQQRLLLASRSNVPVR